MNDQHRILLMEDNAANTRLIREMLATAAGSQFILEHCDRLATGLARLAKGGIDLVLLDLFLPDSQGLDTCIKVHAQAPEVPILVLTGFYDEALAIKALQNGAHDFLVKDKINGPALARSIRYTIHRHKTFVEQFGRAQPPKPGKVLGFIGAKGGVGTTTVALNVAAALSKQQRSVVAVELRSYFGSFAQHLKQTPENNLRTLLELEPDQITRRELAKCVISSQSGVRVLFGPQKIEEIKEIEPEQAEAVIKGLTQMGEFVVVDLPSYPSSANRAALRVCDLVGLVVEPEPTCINAGKMALALFKSWGVSGSLIGAVVVNAKPSAMGMNVSEISARLGCEVVGVVPPAAEACLVAQQAGVPLVLSQPENRAANNLSEIANRLAAGKMIRLSL